LKTGGDRSLNSAGPNAWNLHPQSLWAGALACTDATHGTASALLRYDLLTTLMATHLIHLLFRLILLRKSGLTPCP